MLLALASQAMSVRADEVAALQPVMAPAVAAALSSAGSTAASATVSVAVGARKRAGETKRARTRAAVLAAATELFDQRGLADVTTSQVAEAAGVSVASLYAHFPSKGVLGAWVLHGHLADVLDLGRFAEEDTVEALDCFVDRLTTGCCAHARLVVDLSLLTARLHDSPPREGTPMPADIVPAVRSLAELIRRGQREGRFLPYPPPRTAAFTVTYLLLARLTYDRPVDRVATSLLMRTTARRLLGLPDPDGVGGPGPESAAPAQASGSAPPMSSPASSSGVS